MKPFEQLTPTGKIRRLRALALEALKAYPFQVRSVRFLAQDSNTMFKVTSAQGKRTVLRIYSNEDSSLRETQAEVFWLDALCRDTNLRVPRPLPRKDGDLISRLRLPGVPGEKRCVLFTWIPGRPLESAINPENYYKLGHAMAALHKHATGLNPLPDQIQPKRWDKVFYYPDEPVVYNRTDYGHLFSPQQVDLINQLIVRADDLFEHLFSGPQKPILIHGDLHYWNVHHYRGELYLLDFEDIMLGYPIQDIAVSFYYIEDRDDYPDLQIAFHQGYTTLLPWPDLNDYQIATLMAARSANFMNYVARIDPEPQNFIQRRCLYLQRYLDLA